VPSASQVSKDLWFHCEARTEVSSARKLRIPIVFLCAVQASHLISLKPLPRWSTRSSRSIDEPSPLYLLIGDPAPFTQSSHKLFFAHTLSSSSALSHNSLHYILFFGRKQRTPPATVLRQCHPRSLYLIDSFDLPFL
jgi:hypothetical protein